MKHLFKWLAFGLTSTLLLTACGTANTGTTNATEPVTVNNETPPSMPLSEGEAPISTLRTKEGKCPDPLRAELSLWDSTEDVWYTLDDVFPDNLIVNREHHYTAQLRLHSDGDTIKNIRVKAQLSDTETNPQINYIRFVASDNETGQLLLTARLYLEANDGETFEIQPYDTDSALHHDGILIDDIDNEPTDINFEFSVPHLE